MVSFDACWAIDLCSEARFKSGGMEPDEMVTVLIEMVKNGHFVEMMCVQQRRRKQE